MSERRPTEATPHLDEVERLRSGLWGAAAEPEASLSLHAAGCAECRGEIALYSRLRGTFARLADAEVPHAALDRSLRAARGEAVAVPVDHGEIDVSWLRPTALPGLAGMRSSAVQDVHVTWSVGEEQGDVLLHPAGRAGRFALSGQLLGPGSTPAEDVEVTLFVDRRCAGSARTDPFGEFAFGARDGGRFGLKIGSDANARHIEVWPNEVGK